MTSTHTKSCWSRVRTGGPREHEEDLETLGPEPEQTDDQIIAEEAPRCIYDEDSKVFDLRKIKATDLRDCPRLQLPAARPQEEELMISAKEHLWSQRYAI